MSYVVNVMIIGDYVEDVLPEINQGMKELFDEIHEGENNYVPLKLVDPHSVGGNMMMESDVAIGAWNYFPNIPEFVAMILKFSKGDNKYLYEDLLFLWKEQHQDWWRCNNLNDLNNFK